MKLRHLLMTTIASLALAGTAVAQVPAASVIHMSQVGFETHGPKSATVVNLSTRPQPWKLMDAAGETVIEGQTRVFGQDATSGLHLHTVDFATLDTPGTGYRLAVGDQLSRPFAVADHPYRHLKVDALAFFYENRSGVEIAARHVARPDLARPAGHAPDRVTCFSGTDVRGNVWPGCDYVLDVSGGWYDAGDHGKYVVNGGISVWTLLNLYERAQANGSAAAFPDGAADIPEAGNGVDDLLDEARWELEFLLRMQIPDGIQAQVPVGRFDQDQPLTFTSIDAGGLVHHKVHDEKWTALPTAPASDPEVRFLYAPNTAATLNLVAVAAQCARLWREIDPEFSHTCLTAARRGFRAALRHRDIHAVGSFDGGGDYGDSDLSDEFYWATAELFVTTGSDAYLTALKTSPYYLGAPRSGPSATGDIGWNSVGALGSISLAIATSPLPDADRQTVRDRLIETAGGYLADGAGQGYGLPFAGPDYSWGSNGNLMNRAMILGLAHDFTGERRFRDGVVSALDYVLGRNPLDQSYITGYGDRPMRNPHHRFWAPSLDSAYPEPPAGALSGGPNNTNMSDPVALALRGDCAPQTCWRDDVQAYSLNEVAINWNAPLVWVAAFVDEH
ncbi:glycoside hydrolase family 9 protein [Brevundimonas sp.]|uniref:glycoside hydrolase family 9 protein n=1 Tax=Brevundimonas sp. TaxID=1871086 RepID=UPI003A8CB054